MKQFAVRCAVVAAFGLAVATYSVDTSANNLATPDSKEIMQKVNGKGGLKGAIEEGLKAKEPKWDDLSSKAKELTPLAKALGDNKPPKGDDASWKKHTEAYAKAAVDFETATGKKDLAAANTAFKGITACGGCHMAHRVKK